MIIFAYHFRHRKTIDFIQRCYDYGYKIEMVQALFTQISPVSTHQRINELSLAVIERRK